MAAQYPMSDLGSFFKALGVTLGTALSLHFLLQNLLELSKPPLPPSPRSYPLVGHLLSMPKHNQHIGFIELGKQLKSDILSLRVLGNTMIILNSVEEAKNLLQNRSGVYSGRPSPPMLTDPLMRVGRSWNEARMLLQRLIRDNPASSEVLFHEVFMALSGTLLRSIYGYQISSKDDPFLVDAIQLVRNLSDAVMPENFLVNVFPNLRYIPSWFPGAGWKRVAQGWREQKERTMKGLFNKTKEAIASGSYEQSILSSSLADVENLGLSPEEVDDYLSYIGITLYLAGAETTSNVILIFTIAMMLHPDVQHKAQLEIDNLIGSSRLPVMDDRSKLPYTNCVIQEIFRWCPPVPTGVPHATTDEDIYQGFRIPKGAFVFANIWAMSRNEKIYEKPEEFNPDRFLDPSLPPCPIFGFGRRECPGNHFAESSIFIIVASLLAVFNIKIPQNSKGENVVPKLTCNNTLIYHPDEFQVKLEPRSAHHVHLLRTEG
ncbi:unnamed protein product [Rhizoctonia solani]|uniref:O-methylsterigmatocystin oxidoreductase n=1 Tax=Rhizoctonia solani TaxID=456999 RepID=A0A8H3B0P1_9AGAM|nr:unnamed protein product [Rhizoctonia solani]